LNTAKSALFLSVRRPIKRDEKIHIRLYQDLVTEADVVALEAAQDRGPDRGGESIKEASLRKSPRKERKVETIESDVERKREN
jgi:hypothetical protein